MPPEFSKSNSPRMFDSIAGRYDFVNSFISLGQHGRWRRAMLSHLPQPRLGQAGLDVLDLATGTGDVAVTLVHDERVARVCGIDLSEGMLALAARKIAEHRLNDRIKLQRMDAMKLSFSDRAFDAATMAFGIRNVPDPKVCLSEILRVLRPSGRALILESSVPENPMIRLGNTTYVRWIMPWLGGLLSGQPSAYQYLNSTIRSFPSGTAFAALMQDAGFRDVSLTPFCAGSVHLYWGTK